MSELRSSNDEKNPLSPPQFRSQSRAAYDFPMSQYRDISDALNEPHDYFPYDTMPPSSFSFTNDNYRSVFGQEEEVYRSIAPAPSSLQTSSQPPSWATPSPFNDLSFGDLIKPSLSHSFDAHPLKPQQYQSKSKIQNPFFQPIIDYEVTADPMPPSVPGGYLEPQYHFFSSSSPSDLFRALESALTFNKLDHQSFPEKFKFKCESIVQNCRIPFCVRIFTHSSTGPLSSSKAQYAVEFQRRSGCVMKFSSLYNTIRKELADLGFCAPSTTTTRSFVAPPLPSNLQSIESTETATTLATVVKSANSEYVEPRLESLQALALLSTQQKTMDALTNTANTKTSQLLESVVDTLVDSLQFSCQDVQRCALTTLANISAHKTVCDRLVAEGACDLLFGFADDAPSLTSTRLGTSVEPTTPLMLKEVATTVTNIATFCAQAMNDEFRRGFQTLSTRADLAPAPPVSIGHMLSSVHI